MKIQQRLLTKGSAFLLISSFLYSCTQVPQRKKMPGYLQSQSFEDEDPFQTGNRYNIAGLELTAAPVDIVSGGRMEKYISIPLPDASYDAMVTNLFQSYKLLAVPLLTEWAKQGRNGVVLDLRSNTAQSGSQTGYSLQKGSDFSIPVIFIWDAGSASRATSLMQLAQDIPGVDFRKNE